MVPIERKKICDICGGTGQRSYFKGVSRFLLSSEECDVCAGTGFQLETPAEHSANSSLPHTKKKKKGN